MGMYTDIKFKGYVKPEFKKDFRDIAMFGKWKDSADEVLRKFGEYSRSSFIPCGGSYLWQEERVYDEASGYWAFTCSLKNYDGTFQEFFKLIPHFIESIVHLEYIYEEDDYSQKYELIDGEVVMTNSEFIEY